MHLSAGASCWPLTLNYLAFWGREQQWYLGLALVTACGFLVFGAASVCYRSVWHQHSSAHPAAEAYITAVTLISAAVRPFLWSAHACNYSAKGLQGSICSRNNVVVVKAKQLGF